eukprot:4989374-Pyramimonas_sp.AAC.1
MNKKLVRCEFALSSAANLEFEIWNVQVKDPKQRITASEALKHPWLKVGGEAPDTELDDTVLHRLK